MPDGGEGMHRLNVTILGIEGTPGGGITHWVGSPAVEGGELQGIDMSPTIGPPRFDYDIDGNNRTQYKFNLETKVLGTTAVARRAFIDYFSKGTTFTSLFISGLPIGLDWIIESANTRHNADGNQPSTLSIVLAEIGPTGSAAELGSGNDAHSTLPISNIVLP